MTNNLLICINKVGGLYNFRREVVKAIVDAGYKVFISVPDDDPRAEFFQKMGCVVVKTPFNRRGMNPLGDLKLLVAYRRLIKKIKPFAVLTYTIKPNVYGGIVSRLFNIPQIANVTGLGDAVENGGWLHKLSVFLYRLGIKKAKCVFFQNNSNREQFIRLGVVSKDVSLLPGSGVNIEHHIFQSYPNDECIVRFLFIGRMLKDKGIEEYLKAAKCIKDKYPNTVFQVLGNVEGAYQSVLDKLTEQGIVEYLGVTSDVRPYLSKVECTILPSYHEGMSNVNLESAANGRPVITTNVPGCRETVDDGVTGFLVEPRNVDDLIRKVEEFINLPYSKKKNMGLEARRKVEKEFDRRIVVNAYLKEINSLKNHV